MTQDRGAPSASSKQGGSRAGSRILARAGRAVRPLNAGTELSDPFFGQEHPRPCVKSSLLLHSRSFPVCPPRLYL